MYRAVLVATILCTPLLGGEPVGKLDQLKWIAGTWSGAMWGGTFTAHYSAPADGIMLSYSELKKSGRTAFYEFERFHDSDAGVFYTPYPRGSQKETFKLMRSDKELAVFENPKKDFPTRITFRRKGNALTITLSEIKGDKKEIFALKRP